MRDVEVKKREWVKTAAIVFLAVMLVLTFFSNTIMNRSLPEVAAEYTRSATITARIRGSGTVVANELFEVTSDNITTVNQVHVKLGDEVSPGDVLITLSKENDKELEELEKELNEKKFELERFLVSADPENDYKKALISLQGARIGLTNAQEDRAKAQEALTKAQQERDAIGFDEAKYNEARADIDRAIVTRDRRKAEESDATRRLSDYIQIHNMVVSNTPTATPAGLSTDNVINWGTGDRATYENLVNNQNEAIEKHTDAQRSLDRLEYDRKYAEDNLGRWKLANESVEAADKALTTAKRAVISAQQELDAASATAALTKELDETLFGIDVKDKERVIEELQEKYDELTAEGSATEITSKVSGKVTQINVTSGRQTTADKPLMVIEVPDMGYTVSIPVTSNQSSRVRVGETAEVDRGWYSSGEPITAVLTSIRSDPENPQGGRLLVFSLTGDGIEGGTQLNITIAQQSENYGIVVPNSAVRSDTNGDFVLIVETRSSPLRNRYIATRVDVSILATDDTNSAINAAGLTGWDFVITTSTRPIEPGMQVRLVDNP